MTLIKRCRYLDPKSDVVFKKIFGNHKHLLISFLNALLPLPKGEHIKSLEYLPSEQVPQIEGLKSTVVDVKCKDEKGKIFIVEMQIQWSAAFKQRLLFGTSKAYVTQLDQGVSYNLLKPVYGLSLIGEIFDKRSDAFYHHYKIVNIKDTDQEIKGLQLIFIELPKFKPANYSEQKLRFLWLKFMSEIGEKHDTVDPILLEVPEIKEAVHLAEQAAFTRGELEAYDQYWDAVRRERSFYYERYEEGLEEGEKKMVKKMVENMTIKGFSKEMISSATGLSITEIDTMIGENQELLSECDN